MTGRKEHPLDRVLVACTFSREQASALVPALDELRTIIGGRIEHAVCTPAQEASLTLATAAIGQLRAALVSAGAAPDTRYPGKGQEGVRPRRMTAHKEEWL